MTDKTLREALEAALALIQDLTDSIRYADRVQALEEQLRAALAAPVVEAAQTGAPTTVDLNLWKHRILPQGTEQPSSLHWDEPERRDVSPQAEPDYSDMSREALERHAKRMAQALADDKPRAFWQRHAMGPMMAPSCLCCGKLPAKVAIKHMELPGIVICEDCRNAASRPPAVEAEPVAQWQYRWLNPGDDRNISPSRLDWQPVKPDALQTMSEKVTELRAYKFLGKPCYEVRPLYAAPLQQPQEGRVPLTGEQISTLARNIGIGTFATVAAAFHAGVREAERAHGIIPKQPK